MEIEKAFDTIDHNYLISTLEKCSFGKNSVLWVKIYVIKNGKTLKYFSLGRGTLQDDPISPF